MNKKYLEVIEINLGIDIAEEIRRKTDAMTSIDINLAKLSASKEKKDDKGSQWLAKCVMIADKIVAAPSGLTKEEICELTSIKDTQLSVFTGKLRSYLRLERRIDLIKQTTGNKTVYFTRPIEPGQPQQTDQTRLDQQIVDQDLLEQQTPPEQTL